MELTVSQLTLGLLALLGAVDLYLWACRRNQEKSK